LVRVLLNVFYKLHNRLPHQIAGIDIELCADGINIFLEFQWHSETSLKFVFLNHNWFSVLSVGGGEIPMNSEEFIWKVDL
jgi:hypothetical protein